MEVVKPDQENNRGLLWLSHETHKYNLWANVDI